MIDEFYCQALNLVGCRALPTAEKELVNDIATALRRVRDAEREACVQVAESVCNAR